MTLLSILIAGIMFILIAAFYDALKEGRYTKKEPNKRFSLIDELLDVE